MTSKSHGGGWGWIIPTCLLVSLSARGAELAHSSARLEKLEQSVGALNKTVEDMKEELEKTKDLADAARPGKHDVLLSGHIRTGLTGVQGDASSFNVVVRIHPYWKINDSTICKSDHQFASIGNRTEVFLFFANCNFIVHDYMTITVGKYLSPFGFFQEYVHTEWINKPPNEPLVVSDDPFADGLELVPTTDLGVQVHGWVPIGRYGSTYSLSVNNGPRLDAGAVHPEDPGRLNYDNYRDNNGNKSIDGRFSFFPTPLLQIGYSFLYGGVGTTGTRFSDAKVFTQGIDLSYADYIEWLKGRLEVRSEWIRSSVTAEDFGQGSYENTRGGGYFQFSYRPLGVKSRILKNFEPVFRYDYANLPKGAPVFDQQRWLVGLDYWPWPAFVLKIAYQRANKELSTGGTLPVETYFAQLALGF